MSYQVLARKWRPRTFEDMVGQEHVLQALIHALESQRLHHAYLFTGTRGVGKTTIGRLLARCRAAIRSPRAGDRGAERRRDCDYWTDMRRPVRLTQRLSRRAQVKASQDEG